LSDKDGYLFINITALAQSIVEVRRNDEPEIRLSLSRFSTFTNTIVVADGETISIYISPEIGAIQAFYVPEYAPTSGGGSGGTTDHNLLTNRALADQHTISAITNLQDNLDAHSNDIIALQQRSAFKTYVHIQDTLAATWNCVHNFDHKLVKVLSLNEDDLNIVGVPNWDTSTEDILRLNFSEPVRGTAWITL
jgi:hypothetical protein